MLVGASAVAGNLVVAASLAVVGLAVEKSVGGSRSWAERPVVDDRVSPLEITGGSLVWREWMWMWKSGRKDHDL